MAPGPDDAMGVTPLGQETPEAGRAVQSSRPRGWSQRRPIKEDGLIPFNQPLVRNQLMAARSGN